MRAFSQAKVSNLIPVDHEGQVRSSQLSTASCDMNADIRFPELILNSAMARFNAGLNRAGACRMTAWKILRSIGRVINYFEKFEDMF